MSGAFPNPYGPPEEPAPAPAPERPGDDDEELERALRESLALQEQERAQRALLEEDEMEAALRASRAEEARLREHDRDLERAMEQSRQEMFKDKRRREAEFRRHQLLELEIMEQSRREHEARARMSLTPPRAQAVNREEESLLWLGGGTQPGSSSNSSAGGDRRGSAASTALRSDRSATPSEPAGPAATGHLVDLASPPPPEAGSPAVQPPPPSSPPPESPQARQRPLPQPPQARVPAASAAGTPFAAQQAPAEPPAPAPPETMASATSRRAPAADEPASAWPNPYERPSAPVRSETRSSAAQLGAAPPMPGRELSPGDTGSENEASGQAPGNVYPPEYADGQPALRGVQFGWADSPFATELWATPGMNDVLFQTPELPSLPITPLGDEQPAVHFPGTIDLDTPAWFVLRAYSWRILLQAMAWYGKTSVVGSGKLTMEIAFSIPRRGDLPATGAHVSLAMHAAPARPMPGSSDALEAFCRTHQATPSLVSLAEHELVLPTDLVTLAHSLYSAPQLSTATALRELSVLITHQDEWLDARRRVLRAPHAGMSPLERLEHGFMHNKLTTLASPVDSVEEAPDQGDDDGGSHRDHLRQRVRKHLARWQQPANASDEELATWITPFDLPPRPSS